LHIVFKLPDGPVALVDNDVAGNSGNTENIAVVLAALG
jgi:hypothetical protein